MKRYDYTVFLHDQEEQHRHAATLRMARRLRREAPSGRSARLPVRLRDDQRRLQLPEGVPLR